MTKHSYEEVARAVKRGKTLVVNPLPNTQVSIRAAKADDAWELLTALEPVEQPTPEQWSQHMREQIENALDVCTEIDEEGVREFITYLTVRFNV